MHEIKMRCLEVSLVTGMLIVYFTLDARSQYTLPTTEKPLTGDGGEMDNIKSCKEILNLDSSTQEKDGVYDIYYGDEKIKVLCDMTTDGGGWTVIQRRQDGSMDFYQSWADYGKGFGSPWSDYWIGNDVINSLTSEMNHELRVDLLSFDCEESYARYSSFHVGDQSSGYAITVSGYTGSAGDNLRCNNGMKFSTYDKDNDEVADGNCAKELHGGWWYRDYSDSSLNGKYKDYHEQCLSYVAWWAWKPVSLKGSVMIIRPNVD